jgi:hypothetical protein
MGLAVPVALLLLATGIAPCAELPENSHRTKYLKDTFGIKALASATAGASIQQLRHKPQEWGRGIGGFGKRFGSAMGVHVVKNTIEFGVAKARHEELTYHRSGKTGFGPRLKYALLSTVVTNKTTTGEQTVAVGRISGSFGSGFISRLWQPASLHTVGSGFATGGILLGVDAGTHVLREFWPEIRHPHGH